MRLTFDSFGLDSYELFIKSKALPESELVYDRESDCYIITAPARFATLLGVQVPDDGGNRLPYAEHSF